MKVESAEFQFRGWVFTFIPVYKSIPEWSPRYTTLWHVIIWHNGKWTETFYYAFAPTAFCCRNIKKNKRHTSI